MSEDGIWANYVPPVFPAPVKTSLGTGEKPFSCIATSKMTAILLHIDRLEERWEIMLLYGKKELSKKWGQIHLVL
jgi:hypothetical protein